jgi:hypothetical protein
MQIDLVFQANIGKEKNLNELRKYLYKKLQTYNSFIIAIKSNY